MSQEIINYGAAPNDGTGDPLRVAFIKTDNNFDQIWAAGPVGSNITILNNTIQVTNTNGNLELATNGTGIISTRNHVRPNVSRVYDLGTANLRYRSGYFSGLNIDGNVTITGNLSAGNLSYTGNVFVGDLQGSVFADDSTIMVDAVDNVLRAGAIYTDDYFYANGEPFGSNTGNVTFSDQIVIGTGSNDGGGGLYLAPGNASIANSAVQYLRVRGGDYPTHIHLDTGNNEYYDQYFGADSRYVKLEANGNVVINADDYAGNGATWNFDTDGNLTLPNDANIAIYGNTTQFNTCPNGFLGFNSYDAGGNNIARVGISSADKLVGIGVSDPITENDYNWGFINGGGTIFPTLTVDLHNGGNQTAQTLQFGDPTQQAIITGPTPSANINAQRLIIQGQRGNGTGEGGDVYFWAGDADTNGGDIKIYAGDADVSGYGGYINIDAGSGVDYGGQLTLTSGQSSGGQGGQITITPGYSGDAAGALLSLNGGQGSGDGGPVNITAGYGGANGGQVTITGGQSALGLAHYGNVVVQAGASAWTFDNTGNLTIPGNILGSGNILIVPDSASSSAYLDIYLTGGPDIHIASNDNSIVIGGDTGANIFVGNDGEVSIRTDNGVTAQVWNFDNAGNLTLPGNTFAVNYANGDPVTFTANTGNVTFSDQIVIGTGSNDGGGGLFLAPGPGSIANSAVQYLRVRGGDVATHIHLDTGNNAYYDQYFGADNKFVKLEANGNVVINTDDSNGNGDTWSFDTTGKFNLPGNLVIVGNTNVFGTVSALIQPTDDKPLLAISSGANGAVSSVWVEDIGNVGTSNIAAVYANPTPGSGIVRIAVGQNGGNAGPNLWDFGTDGNLSIPGGGAVWTLGTGTAGLTANFADPYAVNLGLDYTTNTATLAGANTVVIQSNTGANTNQWAFDNTGTLTVPGEGIINSVDDTVTLRSFNTTTGNANSVYLGTSGGLGFNDQEIGGNWLEIFRTGTEPEIRVPVGRGNLNIQTAEGNTAYNWTFDATGNLTVPGNIIMTTGIVGSGASPAPYLSGFSSVSAVTLSASGNVSGNYILGNGSQLTGLPATYGNSNVTTLLSAYGSNTISTTGNITAGNFIGSGSNVELVAGSYTWTFDNTGNLQGNLSLTGGNITINNAPGGNEGAEIKWALPSPANTVLSGTVVQDVFQSGMRFFESGGNTRGLTMDLGNVPDGTATAVGYRDIPQISLSANVTANATNAGRHFYSTTAGNLQITLPDNANVAYPTGATLTVVVNAAGNVVVAQGSGVTLYMAGSSTTGNRTVGAYGLASVMKVATNTWVISGTGVY